MSVLSGPEIRRIIERTRSDRRDGVPMMLPAIDIEPYVPEHVGPNSIDVRLSNKILVYQKNCTDAITGKKFVLLDCSQENPVTEDRIPEFGMVLYPGILYLGSTVEKTMCAGVVPWMDGRSSIGRLGIQIHMTAGRGDDGWEGQWTMEIVVTHPVRVYPNMRIGQITFFRIEGERQPYHGRYAHQDGPTASRMHEDAK